jgi:PAS domain-containing protein
MSPESFYGKSREALVRPGASSEWEHHQALLTARQPFRDFTFRATTDSGDEVWIRCSGVPVFDSTGGFCGYRGMARVVSAEMRAMQAARAAETRLQEALRASADAFALYDSQDALVVWNEAFLRLFPEIEHHLKVGVSFEDILRAALAAGVIPEAHGDGEGWLSERMQAHHQAAGTIERQLSDGRYLSGAGATQSGRRAVTCPRSFVLCAELGPAAMRE